MIRDRPTAQMNRGIGLAAACLLAVACGSRTFLGEIATVGAGSDGPEGGPNDGAADGANDGTLPDGALPDGRLPDGALPDVEEDTMPPCWKIGKPTDAGGCVDTCSSVDPGAIVRCGAVVRRCSELERCENGDCVNDCTRKLGGVRSTVGCDFYAAQMDAYGRVGCYGVALTNGGTEYARITVERPGTALPSIETFASIVRLAQRSPVYLPYDPRFGIPPGETAFLALQDSYCLEIDGRCAPARCPTAAARVANGLDGTGLGTSFHIATSAPVSAVQYMPYGAPLVSSEDLWGKPGATFLLPSSAWSRDFVAISGYGANHWNTAPAFAHHFGVPSLVVIAKEDHTEVTVNPVRGFTGHGCLDGTQAHTPVTYQLDHAQYIQLSTQDELTGSSIASDKPVAVVGGHSGMAVPPNTGDHSFAQQAIPGVQALGSEYVAVPFRNRKPGVGPPESLPYRIVGLAAGTSLAYEPATPPDAPTQIGPGDLVEFTSDAPFVVRSQGAEHPFYASQYMPGSTWGGNAEFVNLIPTAQYQARYDFFADPTFFDETELVLVRARDGASGEYPTVTLPCGGVVGGWTDLTATYQYARVELQSNRLATFGACKCGTNHLGATLASGAAARIAGTVWAWQEGPYEPVDWSGYGFPLGMSLSRLNDVVFAH